MKLILILFLLLINIYAKDKLSIFGEWSISHKAFDRIIKLNSLDIKKPLRITFKRNGQLTISNSKTVLKYKITRKGLIRIYSKKQSTLIELKQSKKEKCFKLKYIGQAYSEERDFKTNTLICKTKELKKNKSIFNNDKKKTENIFNTGKKIKF